MADLAFGDLVSVVVPSYRHERYVENALDSVWAQTYGPIELIVIDDQSPDGTLERVRCWVDARQARQRFHRLVVESNAANCGAHATINRGLELAQGNVLAVLNSDDAYAPERIGKLVQEAARCGASLAFSAVGVIDAEGARCLGADPAAGLEAMADFVAQFPSVSFALLRKNAAVSTGNLMFTRDLLRRVGGFRALRYCHDWDFVLRCCLQTEPMFVKDVLYHYRIHGSNSFTSLKLEQYLEPLAIYRHYFAQCQAGNCCNPRAPWTSNWPGLFERIVAENPTLASAFSLVGGGQVRYDGLAKVVRGMVGAA